MAYEADVNQDFTVDTNTGSVNFIDSVGNQWSSSMTKLQYPSDLFTTSAPISPGVIKFYAHKIITGSQSDSLARASESSVQAIESFKTAAKDSVKKDTNYIQPLSDLAASFSNIAQDAAKKFLTARISTKPAHAAISLYMPSSIQINDSMQYESIDTKGLSEAIAGAVNRPTESADNVANGGARQAIIQSILSKYARSGGPLGGAVANALIAEGIVPNPATKLLFKGPSLRQLQLDFKLIPRSPAEAKTISNIISTFRKSAYPTLHSQTLNALYTVPDIFRIAFQFRNKVNPYMIHFKSMYLTQVTTTYNQSGVAAFYDDASPVETNLTLTFQEAELNSADDVHEGWKSNPSPTARF